MKQRVENDIFSQAVTFKFKQVVTVGVLLLPRESHSFVALVLHFPAGLCNTMFYAAGMSKKKN